MSKLINFVRSSTENNVLFSIPPITDVKVIDCLQSISSHKASGIDKVSPRMLKLAAPIIAPSIAKLIANEQAERRREAGEAAAL